MHFANKIKSDLRFLIIEQDPASFRHLQNGLPEEFGDGCEIEVVNDEKQALGMLRSRQFDIILADIESLSGGRQTIESSISKISQLGAKALVIAISGGGSVSLAVDCMGAGAHDFMVKPLKMNLFGNRIGELGQRHGHAKALNSKIDDDTRSNNFEGFVGTSAQMKAIYEQIIRIAPSSAPVFITGESGTGKEICAQALHQRSPRAKAPFIAINCAAIPHDLMESEIFGVVKGAYTGADKNRMGAAELAQGGVLFLDEIGEMDLSLQAKLLRFLQSGCISRVGEAVSRQVDVRVVCATNNNPMQLIAQKKFREDLFYRLHVLPIHLPPLRQRPVDILPLAQAFLTRYSADENKHFVRFSAKTADLIVAREWPGNVRQLQNLIRRIVVMFDGAEVDEQMLGLADFEFKSLQTGCAPNHMEKVNIEPMWRQEQKIIETAIAHNCGNVSLAAAALEISPSTIYRKKQAWEQLQKNSNNNNIFVA